MKKTLKIYLGNFYKIFGIFSNRFSINTVAIDRERVQKILDLTFEN